MDTLHRTNINCERNVLASGRVSGSTPPKCSQGRRGRRTKQESERNGSTMVDTISLPLGRNGRYRWEIPAGDSFVRQGKRYRQD